MPFYVGGIVAFHTLWQKFFARMCVVKRQEVFTRDLSLKRQPLVFQRLSNLLAEGGLLVRSGIQHLSVVRK